MFPGRLEVQWHIGEEYWEAGQSWMEAAGSQGGIPVVTVERWLLTRLARSLMLILVVVAATTGTSYTWRYQGYMQVRDGIEATLALESRALRDNDQHLLASLIDDQVGLDGLQGWLDLRRMRTFDRQRLRLDAVGLQLVGDLAVVTVRVVPPESFWVPVPYWETRFYRRQGERWLRTVPPITFWGEQHSLETAHLRFEFTQRDAAAVEKSAAQVEAAYRAIHQILGLAPPAAGPKLTFVVEPRMVGGWASSGNRLSLTSPTLFRVPEQASDAERLTNMAVGHLINRALSQTLSVSELYHVRYWYNVVGGIHNWLRVHVLDLPPYWHGQAEQAFRLEGGSYFPLRLTDLTERGQIEPQQRLLRYAAAESLIAYAVETYGREHLPALLQGFRQYNDWYELILGVYGTPAGTFAAGWNLYLAEKYGFSGE